MRVSIRPAEPSDIEPILADIRPADVVEMAALGTTPDEALREGLQRSDWAMTGLLDGVPVCMFGVAPRNVILGEGTPWMLAARGIESAQVAFLRACRPLVLDMLTIYPRLANAVHCENRPAVRWLRWLGFRFRDDETGRAIEYGINGHRFHVFFMGY